MKSSEELTDLEKASQEMIDMQAADGNWNCDPYMHGMLNGMIYIHHLVFHPTDCPDFYEAPDEWVNDPSSSDLRKFRELLEEHPVLKESYDHYCFLLNILKGEDSERFEKIYNYCRSPDRGLSDLAPICAEQTNSSNVRSNP